MEKMSSFLMAMYDHGDNWGQSATEVDIQKATGLSLMDILDSSKEAIAKGLLSDVSTHDHSPAWMLTLDGKQYVEALRE